MLSFVDLWAAVGRKQYAVGVKLGFAFPVRYALK